MNGLICINKDANMTSFDVVKKVKRIYNTNKVGHSGTLDPNATGVLVIAINRATKSLQYLDVFDKTYHAKIKLGLKTHTGDIWGDTLETQDINSFTEEELLSVLSSFIGKQKQRVPMVSAKRVDGKRLYQYVLENKELETQYTDIEIYNIELLSFTDEEIEIRAQVSNGTYIRSLCEDIADKLDNLGSMSYLNREQVGKFTLEDAIRLEELNLETKLLPVKEHLRLPVLDAQEHQKAIMYGQRLILDTKYDDLVLDAGDFYAVYTRESENTFKSIRGLW